MNTIPIFTLDLDKMFDKEVTRLLISCEEALRGIFNSYLEAATKVRCVIGIYTYV
jgi:hypothetical protein